jgi:hypothetical protein
MPDIGWVDPTAAATFFASIGCTDWAALVTAGDSDKLLTRAWYRILYDPRWTIPAAPAAADKAKLAYAQEMTAWYMHIHVDDEDRRKGLQAQAVTQAGIVQETYDKDRAAEIPLPPEAIGILDSMFTTKKPFYVMDIDRREPVGADQDVIDIDNSLNTPGTY